MRIPGEHLKPYGLCSESEEQELSWNAMQHVYERVSAFDVTKESGIGYAAIECDPWVGMVQAAESVSLSGDGYDAVP